MSTGYILQKQTRQTHQAEYLSKVRHQTIPKTGFLELDLCYAKNIIGKSVEDYGFCARQVGLCVYHR